MNSTRSLANTIKKVRSGVVHVVCLNDQERRLASGSSFMSKGRLVTNGHVFDVPPNTHRVWLRQEQHLSREEGVSLLRSEFQERRIVASPSQEYDYAVLDIPELLAFQPYQFEISGPTTKEMGDPVAFLGYPLEHQNLTCHSGIISSFYESGSVEVIQIDASVNPSNSGGPLIDPDTGLVLGIITRKATGLTEMFHSMKEAIKTNIQVISNIPMDIKIGGVSFKQTMSVGQTQILNTLSEIERSANVGIGYAFSCRHLLEEEDFLNRDVSQ